MADGHGIGVFEPSAAFREKINLGRFIRSAAIATEDLAAYVIDQDEEDIRLMSVQWQLKAQVEGTKKRKKAAAH